MSEFNTCRREGRVKWGDDFDSLEEVVGLFGVEDPEALGENFVVVPGKQNVLCCFISERNDGELMYERKLGPELDARGWNETLRYAEKHNGELIRSELTIPKTRLVFWRESRGGQSWYKFAGVFKLSKGYAEDERYRDGLWGGADCWFDRVDTVAECPKADWCVTTFGTEGRYCWDARLEGELVKCDLLDAVECEDGVGKRLGKTVKVWPGTVLRVVQGGVGTRLRCMIEGEGRHFLIPRRDFELGYFRLCGKIGNTKLVKHPAKAPCARREAEIAVKRALRKIDRKMAEYKRILSVPDTNAHKRLVEAICRENDMSLWAFSNEYGHVDAGKVEFEDIPTGYLEAHAIGGYIASIGHGFYFLYDAEDHCIKSVN